MSYSAAIEHGTTGRLYGRIIELPGTISRGNEEAQLLSGLKLLLRNHLTWLGREEESERLNSCEIVVVERILGIPDLGESGGCTALFEYDKCIVTSNQLSHFLWLMDRSRTTLLQLIDRIPPRTLKEKLPNSERSGSKVLAHICNAEEWYKSRLGANADEEYERNIGMPLEQLDKLPPLQRMPIVRRGCTAVLRELVPTMGSKVFTRSEYTSYPEEQWTAYKVLRRYVEHEREHFFSLKDKLHRLKMQE